MNKLSKQEVSGHAFISKDGLYRYHLSRTWDLTKPRLTFVMLNPSTADGQADDPTIRRCIGFARRLNCGSLEVVNLYALRSASPQALWTARDPIGPENDSFIEQTARENNTLIICAWGNDAKPQRAEEVKALLRKAGCVPACFGTTQLGQPRHPLYLRSDCELEQLL